MQSSVVKYMYLYKPQKVHVFIPLLFIFYMIYACFMKNQDSQLTTQLKHGSVTRATATEVSIPCWRRRLVGSWPSLCDWLAAEWEGGSTARGRRSQVAVPDSGRPRGDSLRIPRCDDSMRKGRSLACVWVATWIKTAQADGSST